MSKTTGQVLNKRRILMRPFSGLIFAIVALVLALTVVPAPKARATEAGPPPPDVLERIAVPDSTPELNPYHPANPLYGKYQPPPDLKQLRDQYSRSPLGHGGDHDILGTKIYEQSNPPTYIGAYALQSASTSLTVPAYSCLYAPTLLPSNDARYEVVTAYCNNGDGTQRTWEVYDHGGAEPGWVEDATKIINSTFMNTYTSGGFYRTIIKRYPGVGGVLEWRVYLWNYSTGNWENIVTGSGNAAAAQPFGWDLYEEYLDSCGGDIPEIQASHIEVYTSSGWQFVTSTYGEEWKNFTNCGASNYSTTWYSQYDHWAIDPLY